MTISNFSMERGRMAAPGACLRMRLSASTKALDVTPSGGERRLHMHWTGAQLIATLFAAEENVRLTTETKGHLTKIVWPASLPSFFGPAQLYGAALPWNEGERFWEALPSDEEFYLLSANGWLGRVWLDGPIAHVLPGKRVASYLPPGGPARLSFTNLPNARNPAKTVANEDMKFNPGEWGRRSLVAAAGELAGHFTRTPQVCFGRFDAKTALALTLLRQAYPSHQMTACGPVPFQQWAPAWRRLSQNLGVTPVAATGPDAALPMEPLADLIPDDWVPRIFAALNHYSDLIPVKTL